MRFATFVQGFALLALAAAPLRAETLGELLGREAIDFRPSQAGDLDREVVNGSTLDSEHARVIATYVSGADSPADVLYVFRLDRDDGKWRAVELRWPADPDRYCQGGSIVEITQSQHFVFLDGHRTPSASCTMVLTNDLAFHDTVWGWKRALFDGDLLVYEHSQPHFAPTHPVEVSIYDAVTRRHTPLYPLPHDPPLRRRYLAKVRAAYARCCRARVPRGCGGAFVDRNHHCDPQLFDQALVEVAADEASDALALVVRFEDIVAEHPSVLYVYRHLTRLGPLEVRELPLADARRRLGKGALRTYLQPAALDRLFPKAARPMRPLPADQTVARTSR
jgi:hypothetical protein